ncbi:MAG: hypothetical protein ACSW8G_07680, partial [Bacillota bacterium]
MAENISEHKYLFHHGADYRSYEFLGAHLNRESAADPDAKAGVTFRVWAPRAKTISVVGSFNSWDPAANIMVPLDDDKEIWELTIPEAAEGDLYKFAVTSVSADGIEKTVWKADPFAFFSENGNQSQGSQRASIIYDYRGSYPWADGEWMTERAAKNVYESPMNIYEVHLGSWRRRDDGTTLTYREIADSLIDYARGMGYTTLSFCLS